VVGLAHGTALNVLDNSLLIGFAMLKCDALLARFLLFGIVVGFTELAADAWLVDYTRTLDYSIGGGPMIWRSPVWMPLAWEVVAVQFGYPVLRGDGTSDSLVAIPRLPDDFIYAVVHRSRRIRDCAGVCVIGPQASPQFVARRCCRWPNWWVVDLCLLCRCVSDYRPID
jgi:hypothetical protein